MAAAGIQTFDYRESTYNFMDRLARHVFIGCYIISDFNKPETLACCAFWGCLFGRGRLAEAPGAGVFVRVCLPFCWLAVL